MFSAATLSDIKVVLGYVLSQYQNSLLISTFSCQLQDAASQACHNHRELPELSTQASQRLPMGYNASGSYCQTDMLPPTPVKVQHLFYKV
jgi:hypothetical protein